MSSIGAGLTIDQYTLIRIIGQGGFGTVWLAHSSVLNGHVALKIITSGQDSGGQRELKAVQAYKKLALGGVAGGLIPIEHVGLTPDGMVFYVMPLADGLGTTSPDDAEWKPLTLTARMQQHREQGTWFSSTDIITCFTDICKAAQALSDAELVHRDIKPDNILFLKGRAVISDVSLLTDDAFQGTRYGTPGFSAPSWYMETGGKIDMFSIAATLFTVLTGQSPDKMGRAAFRWPPGGKDRLSESEQNEWARLYRVLLRATHEDAAERFITFSELGKAVGKPLSETVTAGHKKRNERRLIVGLSMAALILIGLFLWISRPELSPDDVWMKIVDAHRNGDITKANSYETTTGMRVAKWLFSQEWVNSKLKPEIMDRSLLGNRYEMECQVIEDGKSETAKLIFKREADDEWRFDDIYLMNLKGVDFHMKLSRFVLNQKEADAELAAKNLDKPNLPEVRFALGSL